MKKERIILTAVKLLKTKIKEMNYSSEFCPISAETGSLKYCKRRLTHVKDLKKYDKLAMLTAEYDQTYRPV